MTRTGKSSHFPWDSPHSGVLSWCHGTGGQTHLFGMAGLRKAACLGVLPGVAHEEGEED